MAIATPYECETTIVHARNMMYLQCNRPFVLQPDFTINAKRAVFKDVLPNLEEEGFPAINYFGIGIRGIKNTTDGHLATVFKTSIKDQDLYTPIPFRMIRKANDYLMSPEERSQYRMRTLVEVDGVEYIQYWLKKLTYNSENVQLIETDFATGTSKEYSLSTTDLYNPEPVMGSSDSVNLGSRLYAATPVTCKITGDEFTEVAAVFPDIANALAGFPLITELGFYTGVDRQVESPIDALSYVESLYTQLAGHMCFRGVDLSQNKSDAEIAIMIENGSGVLNASVQ